MKTLTRTLRTLAGMSLALSLAACNNAANDPAAQSNADKPSQASIPSPPPPPKCSDCGTIVSIEQMKAKGSGSGIGIVLGAVAGAVVGHQVGDGRGQDAATAAGAIGGGFAGNEIEKRVKGTTYFHVTVAMENGGTNIVDVESLNGLSTGSKVKVVGNNLQLASS